MTSFFFAISTLDSEIYLGMKKDVSFVLEDEWLIPDDVREKARILK